MLATFAQNSIGSSSHCSDQKEKKKNLNWKGGSKAITICRRHDTIYRKIVKKSHTQNTVRDNK